MDDKTSNLISGGSTATDVVTLEPVKISSTVHSWLKLLNKVVDVCNIVDFPVAHPSEALYPNLFGFMTSEDKLFLDSLKGGLIPQTVQLPGTRPYSWQVPNAEEYSFGGLNIDAVLVNCINAERKAVHRVVEASTDPSAVSTITINRDSPDVQCIDAKGNIMLAFSSDVDDCGYYAEKTVSILNKKASTSTDNGSILVEYTGNNVSFVNNAVYPNIVYSPIGTQKYTMLLQKTFIVYRMTFIHGRILVTVVENTQLVDNYLARSASDAPFDSIGEASATQTAAVESALNGNRAASRTFWFNANGDVTDSKQGVSEYALEITVADNPSVGWSRFTVKGYIVDPSTGDALPTASVRLSDGYGTAELWDADSVSGLKLVYQLNLPARNIAIHSLERLEARTGRIYDE